MTSKIEYFIENEEIPISDEETQLIPFLCIEVQTDYPNTPIQIRLENSSSFNTQTDNEGVGRCNTSEIKDYHVTVHVHDETFEDDIVIEEED